METPACVWSKEYQINKCHGPGTAGKGTDSGRGADSGTTPVHKVSVSG